MAAATPIDQNPEAFPCFLSLSQSTVSILQFAKSLLVEKEKRSPKEYAEFLKKQGWERTDSNPYIKVAKVFANFAPEDLAQVEPQTIFKLAKSKKFAPLIQELREKAEITQKVIRELIKKYQKPKKPKSQKSTIWKMGADGLPICRIPDIVESDFITGCTIEKGIKQLGLTAVQVVRSAVGMWGTHNGILPLHPEDYSTVESLNQSAESSDDTNDPTPQQENQTVTPQQQAENHQEEIAIAPVIESTEQTNCHNREIENQPNLTSDSAETLNSNNILEINEQYNYQRYIENKVAEIVKEQLNATTWEQVVLATSNSLKEVKEESWKRLDLDQRQRLSQLQKEHIATFQVGDKVDWPNCPAHLNSWSPYTITAINNDKALIDIYQHEVPLAELIKPNKNDF